MDRPDLLSLVIVDVFTLSFLHESTMLVEVVQVGFQSEVQPLCVEKAATTEKVLREVFNNSLF